MSITLAVSKEKLYWTLIFEGYIKGYSYYFGLILINILNNNVELIENFKSVNFYVDNCKIHHSKILFPV